LTDWWCDMPQQLEPALSRALLLLAFLFHAYLWQGGMAAFWHDLVGSAEAVNMEAEEGGLHEFTDNLATGWSRQAHVHPAVVMPFMMSFGIAGGPKSMPEVTVSIVSWLRQMQSLLLLSWLCSIAFLLGIYLRRDRAGISLQRLATASTLLTACLNFYFQGFSARLTDPLVPAWAMLAVAMAQLVDGGCPTPSSRWAGSWCNKFLLFVLCLSYFLAGCYKLSAAGPRWMDGSVLEYYARGYMSEQAWSRSLFSVLNRLHAWPVICTCGLLFELLCPLGLFYSPLRNPVIVVAIGFHTGNLVLITLNGDRFLTWVWTLLFIGDLPAAMVHASIEHLTAGSAPTDDPFLLKPEKLVPVPVDRQDQGTSRLQASYSLLSTGVLMLWLGVGLQRSVHLTHTDWPFAGPDMFSQIGPWSKRSPFPDILQKPELPSSLRRLRSARGQDRAHGSLAPD